MHTVRMRLTEEGAGTTTQLTATFATREYMEQLLAMGMDEGLTEAVGQIDAILVG